MFPAVAVMGLAVSCNDDVIDAVNPTGDARYQLTFTGVWTEADHGPLPGNAHFTTIIGMTHSDAVHLFRVGDLATPGMEDVAERGRIELASGEIDGHIGAGTAFSKPVIGVGDGPLGTGQGEFTVSMDHPYLSVASMIAPSPDWFVGIMDLLLYDQGEWVADTTFYMGNYDGGTEEGTALSGDNPETDPQQPVAPLNEVFAPSLANGTPGGAPMATVRLLRVE